MISGCPVGATGLARIRCRRNMELRIKEGWRERKRRQQTDRQTDID